MDEFKDFITMPVAYNFTVNTFDLQESELTKLGPIYTVLQTFDL